MAMHRKHWPQGARFLPERWIPGSPEHAAAPNAFIPFGDGPRVCVGSRFALQVLFWDSCTYRFCWMYTCL